MLNPLAYLILIIFWQKIIVNDILETGHSHIKRKVNLEKALAGFEKSGHFFFNQPLGYGYDDGLIQQFKCVIY